MISNIPPVDAHTKYDGYGNEAFDIVNRRVGQLNTEGDINMELWSKFILDKSNQFNIGVPPVEEPSVVPAVYFDDVNEVLVYIDADNNRTTYTFGGVVDSVNGQTGDVILDIITDKERSKLAGIEAGAEVNNISDANATDLTDGGTTSLHNHDDIYTRTSSLGDLATLDTVDTAQIDNHAVTNAKLEQMNANTVKGRLSGNGTPQDIAMADLPISTETQNALDGKQATLGYTPENVANKSTSVTTDQASDTKYPSVKSVYDWVTGLGYLLASTALSTYATISSLTSGLATKQDTLVSGTNIKTINGDSLLGSGNLTIGGSSTKTIQLTIPGSQAVDASNAQQQWRNNTGATITISNVAVGLGKPAAGSGAAFTVNLYKSSGTASDGINTGATALFSTAIALGTSAESLTNTPTTTTVEAGRTITIRVIASAGATNFASDASFTITYT